MKTSKLIISGMALILTIPVFAGEWSVEADYVDSCSCNVACPCLFGGNPTKPSCMGQGFLTIKDGHYGEVDLTGVKAHVVYKMGSWETYTVSDKASPEQFAAMRKLMEKAFLMPGAEIAGFKQGRVSIEKKDGHIIFSSDDSMVELEPVLGGDDMPIRIDNHPVFQNYEQYRSVKNWHRSTQAEFSQSGTNGLSSTRSASSE